MDLAGTINRALRRLPAWPVYLVAVLPPAWWFYRGLTGGLGPEPIKELEQRVGLLALQVLIASLAVTPLRRFTGINLIRFRRAIGLSGFYLVCFHLSVWLFLDVQVWSLIWADIVKRPYITIGMAGLALMVPLALTSNDLALRRLGPLRWRRLHRLAYPAIALGAVHFVMLAKGWQLEPLLYLATVLGLLGLRLVPNRRRQPARGAPERPESA